MSEDHVLRDAVAGDVPVLLEIYNHYVVHTHITFDVVPLTLDERMEWFAKFDGSPRNRLVVLEQGGAIAGYAHSLPFRPKKAYETSVETTVYVKPDLHGGGRGRALLSHLIGLLEREDVHRALGGVAQPNDASNRLHMALGYQPIGTFGEVGRKFGTYYDVTWYERRFSRDMTGDGARGTGLAIPVHAEPILFRFDTGRPEMAIFLGTIVFGWLLVASFAHDLIPSDVMVLLAAAVLYLVYMGILFLKAR